MWEWIRFLHHLLRPAPSRTMVSSAPTDRSRSPGLHRRFHHMFDHRPGTGRSSALPMPFAFFNTPVSPKIYSRPALSSVPIFYRRILPTNACIIIHLGSEPVTRNTPQMLQGLLDYKISEICTRPSYPTA